MSTPVTRGELREELDRLEVSFDHKLEKFEVKLDHKFEALDHKIEALDHKFEVRLDLWGGALLERLQTEVARHIRAVLESMSTQISAVDDKYTDLPARVTHLETAVFARTPR
jgi:chaperonin cofactor prefoldin